MTKLPVYILAGGRSSRFGSDKARATLHGQPLILHVATILRSVGSSITVVADCTGKYNDLGLHTIADLNPGLGPLAGLHTALSDLPEEHHWLLLCSCDAVILRQPWLERLVKACGESRQAVAFRSDHWQPMPALYARSAKAQVEKLLSDDGNRSMRRLLDELSVAALPLPPDWPDLWQINTPDDWRRFITTPPIPSHRTCSPSPRTKNG